MNKTTLLICSVIFSFVLFTIISCDDTQEEINKKRNANNYVSDTAELEAIVEPTLEPVIPETRDIPAGLNASTTYWYVAYDVHIAKTDVRYNGYTVITLETQYFDIERAIKQILPSYVKEDYVGMTFFKEVTVETYKAYEKSSL